jgi:PIN domain nuclease of toxin-antitoxin system
MQLLIDSHILVWSTLNSAKLKQRERDALTDDGNAVYFSAVSLAELYIKESAGKLSLPKAFAEALTSQMFSPLPLTPVHTEHVRSLPPSHADPFDRLLAAQAACENLVLMTRDRRLKRYPITIF